MLVSDPFLSSSQYHIIIPNGKGFVLSGGEMTVDLEDFWEMKTCNLKVSSFLACFVDEMNVVSA